MSFNNEGYLFVTVGGDNTLRQFDIRDLSKSDILFDREDDDPFIRVAFNKKNSNQIAMISLFSSKIFVLDVRYSYVPLVELSYHTDRVNNIAWSPETFNSNSYILCCLSDTCICCDY